MSLCGTIATGATYDCSQPIQAGLLNYIILLNRQDIESFTYTGNVISAINLHAGKVGYLFRTYNRGLKAEYKKREARATISYEHRLEFSIPDIASTQKDNLLKMVKGNFVAITFLNNAPGNNNTWFEIYGAGQGIEIQSLSRENASTATRGAYRVVLATGEAITESKLPYTYLNTDYTTSLNDLLELITAGSNNAFPYIFPYNLA